MKYEKIFCVISAIVFLITIALFTLIILNAVGTLNMKTGMLLMLIMAFISMVFLSFCCACILGSFHESWKIRRANTGARWR